MRLSRSVSMTLVAALVAAVGPGLHAQGPPSGPAPTIETWWADLEKEEPQASRALLKLAGQPRETTAFLKEKMIPLKVDAARVQFLLTMLGDEKEEIWRPAFEELEYFDPRLAIDIEELMPMAPEAPTQQRMVEVLSGRPAGSLALRRVVLRKQGKPEDRHFNFYADNFGSWWAEAKVERMTTETGWGTPKKKWIRAMRAISLLESFGTPEAIDLIKTMATGHPDAQPTKVAKETLERMGVKAG